MTDDHCLKLIEAKKAGKMIEVRYVNPSTYAFDPWQEIMGSVWSQGAPDENLRIRPDKAKRPLSQSDAIQFRLFRCSAKIESLTPRVYALEGIYFSATEMETYDILMDEEWQCSKDGVQWEPCWKEVE